MVGYRIKIIRKKLAMTQSELADALCVTKGLISGLEKGNKSPSAILLELLIFKFGVSREWLLGGTGEMFEETPQSKVSLSSKAMVTAAVIGTALPQAAVGLIAAVGAANVVKRICRAYGVKNQSELATECLGVRKSTVSNWIQQNKVPPKYVYKVIKETGVSFDSLIEEEIFKANKSELAKAVKKLFAESPVSRLGEDELVDLLERTISGDHEQSDK